MTSFLIVEGKKASHGKKRKLPCKKVAFSEYTWQFESLPDVGLVEVFLDHSKQYSVNNKVGVEKF
ncbi:UNVERIFIED_CONTAM: hypothetical protein NCL1_03957 [Trichonephila clavipes]